MAPNISTQGCFGFIILSIVVLLTSSTESIPSLPQDSFISEADIVTYQRVERSPNEETFQSNNPEKGEDLESVEENPNETQLTSEQSRSEEITGQNNVEKNKETPQLIKADQNKNKQNEPKKYNANDFKNKLSVESKTSASNESAIDKQNPLYNANPVVKYNNSFKKDTKLNASLSDYNYKAENSNLKVPSKFILEKKKAKPDADVVPINVTKANVNESRVMSDQPAEIISEMTQNITDVSDDDAVDGLLQNTTSFSDENNNTTADFSTTTIQPDDIDIVVISGVTLATAVLLGLIAGGGFVYYRHRMWNKPQTLSDKCSNADSSGYIDDSTLRENSEEMYSLDNDSFLNSLEAMTIQNYWTDNVKHTKL